MQILAISGGLRKSSSNTAFLEAVASVAVDHFSISVYKGLAEITSFDPDLDDSPACEPVARLRLAVSTADALVLSTPEYAHGIPGSLKNASDWLVGSGELFGKPVTLFHVSDRGVYAQESLREVLRIMGTHLITDSELTIVPPWSSADVEFRSKINVALQILDETVSRVQAVQPNCIID